MTLSDLPLKRLTVFLASHIMRGTEVSLLYSNHFDRLLWPPCGTLNLPRLERLLRPCDVARISSRETTELGSCLLPSEEWYQKNCQQSYMTSCCRHFSFWCLFICLWLLTQEDWLTYHEMLLLSFQNQLQGDKYLLKMAMFISWLLLTSVNSGKTK